MFSDFDQPFLSVDGEYIHSRQMLFLFIRFDLLCLTPLSAIFQLYHGASFSGGRSQSTRREPSTMGVVTLHKMNKE
jgi:hypothetical protein